MSLTTNTVNSKSSLYVEAISINTVQLPLDVVPIILKTLEATDLSTLCLVCKNWNSVFDNDDLKIKIIWPPHFNGPEKWTEYANVDAGEAPALPRSVLRIMQKREHILTFIPETVKTINNDGTEIPVSINSLEVIGNLFLHTINERKIGFYTNAIEREIKEERPTEKAHWVLISKKPMGINLNYEKQLNEAKNLRTTMSEPIDTVISLFMEYLRTGTFHFSEKSAYNSILSSQIRVDAKINRLFLNFVDSCLDVDSLFDDYSGSDMAFAASWKFF